ncbi:hypothetical protein BDR22DRAFT_868472 [Usnea florida]
MKCSKAGKLPKNLDVREKPFVSGQLIIEGMLGNICVYNFFGHDVTAVSLAYSMLFVAHPKVFNVRRKASEAPALSRSIARNTLSLQSTS